jgi:hypothetical protein
MKYLAILLIFGFGISGSLGQTVKSLGYNATNGQVVTSTGTNTLTFTNRFGQSSTNATNPPEIRLTTRSNNVASWFVYDAIQTNPAAPNWSVAFMGLNTVPNGTGTDRALLNQGIGGASFTIENMWVSPAPDPDAPLAEFYFNITDTNNLTTRGFSVIGNQTNSEIGFSDFRYPVTIFYNSNSRAWYGSDSLGLNVFSTNTGELARFTHSTTNPSGTAQIYLQVQNNQTIWQAGLATTYMRNFGSGRNVFRADSNGVIYGATGANDAPQAPIHLAGNTRIDGAISFNATSNAATTRTNLGLGATWLTNTDVNVFRESLELGTNNAYFDKIKVFTESRGTISPPLTDNPEYGILYARETGDNIVLNIAPSGASGNYTLAFEERLGSWAKTTNSATARTNLGLGGGITATNTFVSYNGTNYTTNTVTISNGIITGWTQ